jgi:cation transport ATPase
MYRRRVGSRRGSSPVLIAVAAICAILAVFATVAWLQDSAYGAAAIILWVLTVIAWFLYRRRARA